MNFNRIITGISLTFFLLVFFVPPIIPFHFFPLGSFWGEWVAGVLVLISWAFIWIDFSKSVPVSLALVPWLIWAGACVLSVLNANYMLYGPVYMVGIFWVMGAICLFLVASLKKRLGLSSLVEKISLILLVAGIFQAILGLARYYGLLATFSPWLSNFGSSRMPGLLNYPTISGFSLWLSLIAVFYLFWKGKIKWMGLLVASFPICLAVVATGDRSSLLYLVAFCLAAIITLTREKPELGLVQGKNELYRIFFGLAGLSLTLLVCIPVYSYIDKNGGQELEKLGYIHRSNLSEPIFSRKKFPIWGIRVSEFRKAIYLARSNFWLGVGTSKYPYQSFRLNSVLNDTVREGTVNSHSHNLFSMVLAEEGMVGVVVVLLSLGLLAYWWWRLTPNADSFFIGAGLALFFVFSNLEYPLWYLNFLVIFMAFCGLVAPVSERPLDNSWVKPGLAVITLIVGGGIALDIGYGFYQISAVASRAKLGMAEIGVLSSWTADRILEPYALLAMERYTLPQPENTKHDLYIADKIISYMPMPKALLDKSTALVFSGKFKKGCRLAERTAYTYPYVMKEFESEQNAYKERHEELPGNVQGLKACIEKGVEQWEKQFEN